MAPTCPRPNHGPPPSTQPQQPPGTFVPQSHPGRTPPSPGPPSTDTRQLKAVAPYSPLPRPQPSSSCLGSRAPFPPSPSSVSLSLSPFPSLSPSLTQEHQVSGWADVFSAHKSICRKSCLIGTRSSEVLMALQQDGFSLGKKLLATGREHRKFGSFLLKA